MVNYYSIFVLAYTHTQHTRTRTHTHAYIWATYNNYPTWNKVYNYPLYTNHDSSEVAVRSFLI